MPRVTVHHRTPHARLVLIEESGLRTRADLSALLGPVGRFDELAPGTFARGRRVSGWLSGAYALGSASDLGAGHVSFTVDPARTLAAPASLRESDLDGYWGQARSLDRWLAEGGVPDDLEVHQNVPVRAKHVQIRAPRFAAEELAVYSPLVDAVADVDRVAAKALMHLAIIASDGDLGGTDFRAACAFAWRDTPDEPGLMRELIETGPDDVASVVLTENAGVAREATDRLRAALEDTRQWAVHAGMDPGEALLERSNEVLDAIERPR